VSVVFMFIIEASTVVLIDASFYLYLVLIIHSKRRVEATITIGTSELQI
jgi:hypothetical protein